MRIPRSDMILKMRRWTLMRATSILTTKRSSLSIVLRLRSKSANDSLASTCTTRCSWTSCIINRTEVAKHRDEARAWKAFTFIIDY